MESFGHNSFIYKPLYVSGTNIHIGDNVYVQYKSWLASESLTGNGEALLKIGNGCVIGHFNEIYSTHSIVIENHVLTADRVYISDNIHGYENIEIPILHQPIVQKKEVRIGEGSWLGVGVSVIGASIGIPARIIKRYNPEVGKWLRTNPDGSFKEIKSSKI